MIFPSWYLDHYSQPAMELQTRGEIAPAEGAVHEILDVWDQPRDAEALFQERLDPLSQDAD